MKMISNLPEILKYRIFDKMELADLSRYCQVSKPVYKTCENFAKGKLKKDYAQFDLSHKTDYLRWLEIITRGDLNNLLVTGIQNKNLSMVKWAVLHGTPVTGSNILTLAVKNGNYEIVQFLIDHKADVNERQGSPLEEAVKHDREDLVWFLVEKGADVNLGQALVYAVQIGSSSIVNFLLNNGIDKKKLLLSALIEAYLQNRQDMAELLIADKKNLENIFLEAAEKGAFNIVKFLVNKIGGDQSVLELGWMTAYAYHQRHIANFLLEHGVSLNELLLKAIMLGSYPLVKYLVEHGADVNGENFLFPLEVAIIYRHYNIATFLLEHGANKYLRLIFMSCVMAGDLNGIKYLVESGFDVKPKYDRSVAAKGYDTLRKFLTEHGGKGSLDQLLHEAINYGVARTLKFIVKNPWSQEVLLGTPLKLAAIMGQYDIVKYLFENGYRQDAEAALSEAIDKGREDIVEYLVNHGVSLSKYVNPLYSPQLEVTMPLSTF